MRMQVLLVIVVSACDGVRDQPCALNVSAIDGDGRAATSERKILAQ